MRYRSFLGLGDDLVAEERLLRAAALPKAEVVRRLQVAAAFLRWPFGGGGLEVDDQAALILDHGIEFADTRLAHHLAVLIHDLKSMIQGGAESQQDADSWF